MQDEDFKWFVENYNDLFNKYGVSYLVISDKKVINSYNEFKHAVDAAKSSLPVGKFIVQFCNGDESGYTNYVAF